MGIGELSQHAGNKHSWLALGGETLQRRSGGFLPMPCPPVVEGMSTSYHFHTPWCQVPSITPPHEQPCGLCLLAFSFTGKEMSESLFHQHPAAIIPLLQALGLQEATPCPYLFSDQAQLQLTLTDPKSHVCVSHSAPAVKEALIK